MSEAGDVPAHHDSPVVARSSARRCSSNDAGDEYETTTKTTRDVRAPTHQSTSRRFVERRRVGLMLNLLAVLCSNSPGLYSSRRNDRLTAS